MIAKMFGAPAIAGAILFTCAGVGGATAAPAPDKAAPPAAESSATLRTVASVTEDDLTNCTRARRRLFVDGEGWIVRRITTCR